MPRITRNGNWLLLTFRYHPRLINAIREIDGRKFNKTEKRWEVPISNVIECVDALKPLGFTLHMDVVEAYEARQKQMVMLSAIKGNPIAYTGNLPLYDYQKAGAAAIAGFDGFLLADVPGLGKTLQTIAGLEGTGGSVLVLCPASLKYNWRDEILKWRPGAIVTVIDGTAEERRMLWPARNAYVIANYELLIRDWKNIPKEWDVIVCDEVDRISNPGTKTTQAVKLLQAKKRIALSGTPIQNRPDDIWSIIDWMYPGMLGTFSQFQKKYCKMHPVWNRVIGYQNLPELSKKVERVMLRRLKEDVLKDLPKKTVEYVRFELSAEERKLYDAVRRNVLKEIKEMSEMDTRQLGLIPVKMLRLKQCTDHSTLVGAKISSSKMETLKEMLHPIAESGDKALIFTQFSSMDKILKNELAIYGPLVIDGDVPAEERKKIVDRFNTDPAARVLIMTEAGTYGLNLQAASYVFHYDAPWSAAKLVQREDRAHRIGQEKPVTVYHLIAKKTIDEYVLKVLKGKQQMSADILGDAEQQERISFETATEILEEDDV